MAKPKIIVTGANGQVGKELQALAGRYPAFDFIFLSREDMSIHHAEMVRNYFETVRPDYCINCAAYTAVDKAENEKEQAMLINADAAGVLALVCKMYDTRFIHISTDYVFDGTATVPYKEEHATNPVNYYGLTKLKGEALCLLQNPDCIIIRTSWVYSEFGSNFVKTMLRLMKERDMLNVVNDQTGSPTYAADLANAMITIINNAEVRPAKHEVPGPDSRLTSGWTPGIYHYSNEGVINWYDFAVAIKELSGSACSVNPIPTSAYPTPAKRPAYSVFSKEKIKRVFGLQIPAWKDSLKQCLAKLS
jgi:dTDP-4-dehydrorhamnose reductase